MDQPPFIERTLAHLAVRDLASPAPSFCPVDAAVCIKLHGDSLGFQVREQMGPRVRSNPIPVTGVTGATDHDVPLLDIPAAVNVIAVLKLPFAKKTGFRMLHYTSSLRARSRPTPVPAVPQALDVKIKVAFGKCDKVAVAKPLRVLQNGNDFRGNAQKHNGI